MAVRHGYGKIAGADALVFAYDTGDTRNSYKGEPTENLADNANFSNGTTNWNGNQNVTLSVETINGTRFLKTSSNQTNSTPGLKSANIPVTGNTTYTLTIRAYKNDSQSAFMYATGNGTGGADIVWSSSSLNGPNPITTELTTISRTFTTPSDMTYIQVGFLWSGPLTTSEVYVEYVQLEQKSHATPFVNGTRSATEALKDFTKNATLDLSNVSFDSNAQMEFDGTDDYISLGTPSVLTSIGASNFTISCWAKADALSTGWTGLVYLGRFGESNGHLGFNPSNNVSGGTGDGSTWQTHQTTYTLTAGTWYNLVMTRSGNFITFYVNGQQIDTPFAHPHTPATASAYLEIGNGSANEHFNGKIDNTQIFNKALSAEEVQQNFNTIKGRFGI